MISKEVLEKLFPQREIAFRYSEVLEAMDEYAAEKDAEISRLKGFVEQFLHDPYPTKTFPALTPDDLYDINQLLKDELKIPIDRLSAHIGRELRKPLMYQAKQLLNL